MSFYFDDEHNLKMLSLDFFSLTWKRYLYRTYLKPTHDTGNLVFAYSSLHVGCWGRGLESVLKAPRIAPKRGKEIPNQLDSPSSANAINQNIHPPQGFTAREANKNLRLCMS